MRVDHGRGHIPMTQQFLHRPSSVVYSWKFPRGRVKQLLQHKPYRKSLRLEEYRVKRPGEMHRIQTGVPRRQGPIQAALRGLASAPCHCALRTLRRLKHSHMSYRYDSNFRCFTPQAGLYTFLRIVTPPSPRKERAAQVGLNSYALRAGVIQPAQSPEVLSHLKSHRADRVEYSGLPNRELEFFTLSFRERGFPYPPQNFLRADSRSVTINSSGE
jgi:hypothetical protein